MAKDYGDRYPSDLDDIKPAAPTVGYSESNIKRSGYRDPRISPQTDFDDDHGIEEQFQVNRFIWTGTILEYIADEYYSVMLQDGQEIIAKSIHWLDNYEFVENQNVLIILDQRYSTFQYDSEITDPGLTEELAETILEYMLENSITQDKSYLIIGQQFNIQAPIQWAKLTEILSVGDEADATILELDETDSYTESTYEVTLQDTFKCNFGFADEIFPYIYDIATQRAIISGSQGLMRMATTIEEIEAGSSGEVEMTKGVDVKIVTAHLIWAHSGSDIPTGKEVFIQYFPDLEKWVIIGREC